MMKDELFLLMRYALIKNKKILKKSNNKSRTDLLNKKINEINKSLDNEPESWGSIIKEFVNNYFDTESISYIYNKSNHSIKDFRFKKGVDLSLFFEDLDYSNALGELTRLKFFEIKEGQIHFSEEGQALVYLEKDNNGSLHQIFNLFFGLQSSSFVNLFSTQIESSSYRCLMMKGVEKQFEKYGLPLVFEYNNDSINYLIKNNSSSGYTDYALFFNGFGKNCTRDHSDLRLKVNISTKDLIGGESEQYYINFEISYNLPVKDSYQALPAIKIILEGPSVKEEKVFNYFEDFNLEKDSIEYIGTLFGKLFKALEDKGYKL